MAPVAEGGGEETKPKKEMTRRGLGGGISKGQGSPGGPPPRTRVRWTLNSVTSRRLRVRSNWDPQAGRAEKGRKEERSRGRSGPGRGGVNIT